MSKDEDGTWRCLSCDFTSKVSSNLVQHIESKHVSVQYNCEFCPKVCPTKKAIQLHITRHHKQAYF